MRLPIEGFKQPWPNRVMPRSMNADAIDRLTVLLPAGNATRSPTPRLGFTAHLEPCLAYAHAAPPLPMISTATPVNDRWAPHADVIGPPEVQRQCPACGAPTSKTLLQPCLPWQGIIGTEFRFPATSPLGVPALQSSPARLGGKWCVFSPDHVGLALAVSRTNNEAFLCLCCWGGHNLSPRADKLATAVPAPRRRTLSGSRQRRPKPRRTPPMAANEPVGTPNNPMVAVNEEAGTKPSGSPNRVAIIVLVVIVIKLIVVFTVLALYGFWSCCLRARQVLVNADCSLPLVRRHKI